jgi:hypothetical protein
VAVHNNWELENKHTSKTCKDGKNWPLSWPQTHCPDDVAVIISEMSVSFCETAPLNIPEGYHLLACWQGNLNNTPASYSGGLRLESQPIKGYLDWSSSWFFSVPSRTCWDGALKLGYCRFLPHSFQFLSHLSPLHLTLYNTSHWKNVFK